MSLKPSIVQEYANKATELNTIEGELYMIDKSLDQESPENDPKFAQKREKDRLLQRDLIDQFNQIRAKELRLLQNEDKFANMFMCMLVQIIHSIWSFYLFVYRTLFL